MSTLSASPSPLANSSPLADERFSAWLAERLEAEAIEISDVRRHVEGFSWETFAFRAHWDLGEGWESAGFVLRREPTDGLLDPYDAPGQFALNRALRTRTAVPVPRERWLQADGSVLDRPFYVMDEVKGHVPVQWLPDDPRAFPTDAARRSIGEQFVGHLATLHAAGASDLGFVAGDSPERVAVAQVDHWHARYADHAIRSVPLLEEAVAWLRANPSVSGRLVVNHGDYRLGNFMLDEGLRINAIFDWELAHLSDPVEDIAWAAMPLFRGRSNLYSQLLPSSEFLSLYRERTGLEVRPDALRFWIVLGYLKASASYIRAARAFEDGRADLRLAAMGHQLGYVLSQLRRVLRQPAEEVI